MFLHFKQKNYYKMLKRKNFLFLNFTPKLLKYRYNLLKELYLTMLIHFNFSKIAIKY